MKLLLEWDGNSEVIDSDSPKTLGRDVTADIRINTTKISRVHARIEYTSVGWEIVDLNSSNGTFYKKKKISRLPIAGQMQINLGGTDGLAIFLSPISSQTTSVQKSAVDHGSTQVIQMQQLRKDLDDSDANPGRVRLQNRIKIGRDKQNDWVIDSLSVSRYHAEISQNSSGDFEVVDLNSANGTFVNGESVKRRQLKGGDLVTFGSVTRRYTQSGLEPIEGLSGSTLVIDNASFFVKDRALLQDISVTLEPRTLTAIIGPSGAGKSTLLNLLSGRISPTSGNVTISELDLEKNHKLLSQRIGFVPQSDIIHSQLTTRQALSYGAELRLSNDTSAEERTLKVDEILEKLELSERQNLLISKLSGGQRKRASIGLELITSPEILVLDEPTSGLDPGLDAHVMETLRKLADEGQTVALVTHSVDNLDFCDNVILMASGGKVAYAGPASTVFLILKKESWAEVFRFLASPEALLLAQPRLNADKVQNSHTEHGENSHRSWLRQTLTLSRRYLRVISADRYYSTLLLAIPILTGLLCYFSGGTQGFGLGHKNKYGFFFNSDARGTILVLILGSVFIGLSTAIQEIVKESAIRKREQAAGVHARAYLLSKIIVLGLITSFQALIFTSIVLFNKPLSPSGVLINNSRLEITALCILLTLTSLTLGILLSSVLSSPEQAMPVLVGATMAEVILSGALPITSSSILQFVANLVPSYWATNGLSASTNIVGIAMVSDKHSKQIWAHSASTVTNSLTYMAAFCLIFTISSGVLVKRNRR